MTFKSVDNFSPLFRILDWSPVISWKAYNVYPIWLVDFENVPLKYWICEGFFDNVCRFVYTGAINNLPAIPARTKHFRFRLQRAHAQTFWALGLATKQPCDSARKQLFISYQASRIARGTNICHRPEGLNESSFVRCLCRAWALALRDSTGAAK